MFFGVTGPTGGSAPQGLEHPAGEGHPRAAIASNGECEFEGPTGAWAGTRGG